MSFVFEEMLGKQVKCVFSEKENDIQVVKGVLKEVTPTHVLLSAFPDNRDFVVKISMIQKMNVLKNQNMEGQI